MDSQTVKVLRGLFNKKRFDFNAGLKLAGSDRVAGGREQEQESVGWHGGCAVVMVMWLTLTP